MPVYLLGPSPIFPSPDLARPDGLIAVGGDLSIERLVSSYRHGIFPWYNPGEPILWWSPDPRLILEPKKLHVSRRLGRIIRQGRFKITLDKAFNEVIRLCAEVRIHAGDETWISNEMITAYSELHRQAIAHSAEAWLDERLAGGLYGVAIGRVFFGESMFSRVDNASKTAFVKLVGQLDAWDFQMIDCQVTTRHLISLGAQDIPRKAFIARLAELIDVPSSAPPGKWDKSHTKTQPMASGQQ